MIEHNKVEELIQRPDGSWDVVTEKGTIHAERGERRWFVGKASWSYGRSGSASFTIEAPLFGD